MNSQELKQCIDKIEECADQAKQAVQAGSAPNELRQSIDQLHQQAREGKQAGAGTGEAQLRECVLKLEQIADRAMQACRNAGSQVDQKTQQAVQRAHDEASRAKKEIQAGSPA